MTEDIIPCKLYLLLVIKIYQRILELQHNKDLCLSARPPHTHDAKNYEWCIEELKRLIN